MGRETERGWGRVDRETERGWTGRQREGGQGEIERVG